MRLSISKLILGSIAVSLYLASASKASVFISFSNSNTGITTSSGSVSTGSSFNFSLFVTSSTANSADQITGIDYVLESLTSSFAAASSIFTITARDSTTGGFQFTNDSDANVVKAANGPGLNPTSFEDLGGGPQNSFTVYSNQTVLVANYTLSVASNAHVGTYDITTALVNSNSTGEYIDGNFNQQPVQKTGNGTDVTPYVITVTPAASPEPGTMGLLAVVSVAGLVRRRRRAV